jgi:hypothetical protein
MLWGYVEKTSSAAAAPAGTSGGNALEAPDLTLRVSSKYLFETFLCILIMILE